MKISVIATAKPPLTEFFNTRSLFEISHSLGPLEMEDKLILPTASLLTIQDGLIDDNGKMDREVPGKMARCRGQIKSF